MANMMRSLQVKEPKLVEQFEKETLFGRIGFPDELKGAILFLCTQASGWYTDRIFWLMVVLAHEAFGFILLVKLLGFCYFYVVDL